MQRNSCREIHYKLECGEMHDIGDAEKCIIILVMLAGDENTGQELALTNFSS